MRILVMTVAVLSALAGALLVGQQPAAEVETDSSDIALFV